MPETLASLRPFRPEDLHSLTQLLGAAGGWATHKAPAPEELQTRWARRQVDPSTAIEVVPGHGGGLIAFLQATPFSDGTSRLGMEIAVHPDYRLRGIGSRLYERALDKAQVRRATRISSPVFVLTGDRNAEGCLFLIKRGFLRQSGYWQMRVDNIEGQAPPRWPPGIEVSPFPDIERAPERWAELIRAAFDEPATTEMVAAQTKEQGSDPSGYFFARDTASGNLVGTSRARLDPAPNRPEGVLGYVGTVGILPEYRRRGIAQALIAQTVCYLKSRGAKSAVLFVEDRNEGARNLYKSMGWYPVFRTDNYWKTLDTPPEPQSEE